MHEAILKDYEECLRFKNYSRDTVKHYTRAVSICLAWLLAEKGLERVQDVKKEDLKDFEFWLHAQVRARDGAPLSVETKAKKILALRSFFNFLFKSNRILYNPVGCLELPRRNHDKLRETLKEKEIKAFLESIKGKNPLEIRDRAMFEFFYSSGLRNSELRNLDLGDVNLKTREVTVKTAKGHFGPRQRIVPFGRVAIGFLEEYLLNGRPKFLKNPMETKLFISSIGRPLSIEIPCQLTREYARRAGFKKRVTPHILRHSFAAHLLHRGADIRYVQEMLGHRCLDSTQIYTKLDITDLKRIHRRCHPRERMIF